MTGGTSTRWDSPNSCRARRIWERNGRPASSGSAASCRLPPPPRSSSGFCGPKGGGVRTRCGGDRRKAPDSGCWRSRTPMPSIGRWPTAEVAAPISLACNTNNLMADDTCVLAVTARGDGPGHDAFDETRSGAPHHSDHPHTLRPVETDTDLLWRLRAGDEQAFVMLVGRYNGSLLRLARSYVPSEAVAEEAVQDTWLGVLRGSTASRGGRPSRPGCSGSSSTGPVVRACESHAPCPSAMVNRRSIHDGSRPTGRGPSRSRRGPIPMTGWWPPPGRSACATPSANFRRGSVRSSSSATSKGCPVTTCATCWASAKATNGSCSTAGAADSVRCSSQSLS